MGNGTGSGIFSGTGTGLGGGWTATVVVGRGDGGLDELDVLLDAPGATVSAASATGRPSRPADIVGDRLNVVQLLTRSTPAAAE